MSFESLLKYPLVFFVAYLTTLCVTPLIIRLAVAWDIVDRPSERRIHSGVIPRAGGLGVFLGFHLGACMIFLVPTTTFRGSLNFEWWLGYLIISSVIVLVGFIDDARGLSAIVKLCAQIILASAMFALGARVGKILGIDLPLLVDLALTVFWFLLVTNAFNLIDGLDGLCAGLGGIAALGIAGSLLFRHLPGDVLVLLSLTGACLGFLHYNFNPASIFLGDTGSLFIGFTLSSVALSTESKGTLLASIGVPILAVGVPLFDTLLAVWRRSVRGILAWIVGERRNGIMEVDTDHLHHRLKRSGLKQRQVALTLYAANIALVTVGMLSLFYRSHVVGIFLLAFLAGAWVIIRHIIQPELWDSGRIILLGTARPLKRRFSILLAPVIDALLITGAFSLTILTSLGSDVSMSIFKGIWLASAPIWVGPTFIALAISGTYRRVWSRARTTEFMMLPVIVTVGALVSVSLTDFIGSHKIMLDSLEVIFYILLTSTVISFARLVPRSVHDVMTFYSGRSPYKKGKKRSILVYGAGVRGMLYLRSLVVKSELTHAEEVEIVGLIDDNPTLLNQSVHGHRVLGSRKDLEQILAKYGVSEIVITTDLDSRSMSELLNLAKLVRVAINEWAPRLECIFLPEEDLIANSIDPNSKEVINLQPSPISSNYETENATNCSNKRDSNRQAV
jgi:UDP-N-acetylmuramyl pentapeptide phosphotransferase/UDP-N-acetylglucosamine-1-phosphate transferase